MSLKAFLVFLLVLASAIPLFAEPVDVIPQLDSLYRLQDGETKQVNALWGENPGTMQFGNGRTMVVIADLKGPGVITMIHFALPQAMKMNRETILRIYWDGETKPSVEAPLVDFFCDPNGALERVDSVLVNKKRGWNCYFPMPFAKSARIELDAAGNPRYPSGEWSKNPCYSYVHYRTLKSLPSDAGYFHAEWRQQIRLLGKEDYKVFEANGKGQFIGWNVTIRGVSPNVGYPVDENVKFYIDGEKNPSVEWQGLEDAFGFSWGFPEQANGFPYTGYQTYYGNGAAAYRFTLNDRISFKKSFRMAVGFAKIEEASFQYYSLPENALELSSVAYWYQKEPHKAFTPLPPSRERRPSLPPPAAQKYRDAGETFVFNCGKMSGDEEFIENGWDFVLKKGYAFCGWPWATEVNHCWADFDSVEFDVICPKGASGTLKLFIIDGDNFLGGRKQSITAAGKLIGEHENFQSGRWVEIPISAADTADGRIPVVVKNLKPKANAVVSMIRFQTVK